MSNNLDACLEYVLNNQSLKVFFTIVEPVTRLEITCIEPVENAGRMVRELIHRGIEISSKVAIPSVNDDLEIVVVTHSLKEFLEKFP